MSEAAPYSLTQADAAYLLSMLDGDQKLPARTKSELESLLRETLNLAQSLSDNCEEWLTLTAICETDIHPHDAEMLNVPTLKGALKAAILIPAVECDRMCHTCAFRVGSIANQSAIVAGDVDYAFDEHVIFYCHDIDDESKAKACAGFMQALNDRRMRSRRLQDKD